MAYTTFTTSIVAPGSGAFTFIKNFHDALITNGLIQTADTGQLDLSTAGPTRNATANFSYGYTVYKLPSVSGLDDIFIRINHTNNNDASPVAYLPRFTIGTATNGAGTITTNSSTELASTTGSVGTTSGTVDHYVSVTDGDLAIAFAPIESQSGINQIYTVARLRDLDGTKRNGYSFLRYPGIGGMAEAIYNPLRTTILTNITSLAFVPYYWTAESTSLKVGDDVPVFPPVILTPEAVTNLPYIISTTDIAVGNTFAVQRFGVTRTYLRVNPAAPVFGGPSTAILSFNIILE